MVPEVVRGVQRSISGPVVVLSGPEGSCGVLRGPEGLMGMEH